MGKEYSFNDLRDEMAGVCLGTRPFSRALKTSLGEEQAVHWFYHTHIPELKDKTPHEYVARGGQRAKESLARDLYYLVTGQPD